MSGAEIYRNFRDGAGTGGLQAGAAVVNEIAVEYVEEAAAIRTLTAKMEAAWQGTAAGAARRGAGPLASEHESSGTALLTAQTLISFEAEVFALSKNSVVPVPPKPQAPNPWTMFVDPGAQIAFEDQVDNHNAAAKHNVAVMAGYTASTSDIAQRLPVEYGTLPSGTADIDVRPGTTIDTSPSDTDGPGDGTDPRTDPGSATEWQQPTDAPAPRTEPVETTDRPDTGSTSPGSFTPTANQPGPAVPGGEPTGTARPLPTSAATSVLIGRPGPAGPRGTTAGPRGGGVFGAAPRDGSLPRAGGAPTPDSPTRTPSGMAVSGGRTGPTAHGVPLGAPGRGRDEEDRERRRPTYLEGDDPEDLFGSEALTAPPTIGAEDDD